MKKIMFSILVIAAVLVAGCVQEGPGGIATATATGLEITDFTVEPAEVRAESTASFVITAENQGEFKINKNNALFKLILPSDWSIIVPNTKGEDPLDKDMIPADPSIDRAADIVSERFKAKAPSLSRGQTRTDQTTIRAYYEYQTDANGVVYLYPYGEEREDVSSFQSDNAPIRLDVRTSPTAPVIEEGDYFTLVIDVTNIGSGKVYKSTTEDYTTIPTLGVNDYNKVNITIDIKGEYDGEYDEYASSEPTGETGWDYWLMDNDCAGRETGDISGKHEWELYGKTNPKTTIMCDVKVNHNIVATKKPVAIVVSARYGYYTEAKDSITIIGRD